MFHSEPMFVHIITLCLGLIIAFGLQQIVDLFLRRRRARKQQADEAQSHESSTKPPPPQSH